MWWLLGWAYDYFVSRMDAEKRKEFDERLDDIRNYDERREAARRERRAQVQAMQGNL